MTNPNTYSQVDKCISCGAGPEQHKTLVETKEIHKGIFFGKTNKVVQCKNCGLVFLNPKPSISDYEEYYSSVYNAKPSMPNLKKRSLDVLKYSGVFLKSGAILFRLKMRLLKLVVGLEPLFIHLWKSIVRILINPKFII